MPTVALPTSLIASLVFLLGWSSFSSAAAEPLLLAAEPRLTRVETTSASPPQGFAARDDVQAFIATMHREHGFSREYLNRLFAAVEFQEHIIGLISRPAEKTKPWYEYREIFLDQARIDQGRQFWREHRDTLARAQEVYGVDPAIIVAILGVETRYGRITGNDRVLDALSTLTFGYPRRAPFFRGELEAYLLLTHQEGIDPLALKGSYAGAMGLAQFMPSSYRAYAVDFDGDGKRDLWQNPVDAIGSIGNYLAEHGWQRGGAIIVAADVGNTDHSAMISRGRDFKRYPLATLRQQGIQTTQPVAGNPDVLLLAFKTGNGVRRYIGLPNFYTITRYNHSPLYAMAVYELGQAIRSQLSGISSPVTG